ncbi:serpin family protein [Pasteurella skyensis]|uniref:Serpin family protein n=1 Tax=Phocoenobacter skyensis TaxID=97481 RepID=A0AAJ6ND56_9PAST|nr:serpin family protein [Pasteurella skyensis]MDP8162176.1 serpin family protein [Pasteurella skyensis]MDP8170542.1 serpin family protein [Pasteurella skyensis]MDP8172640.1 serpin family protein [Pasteurella skyensis]MDP8174631.1 serpin family protein [Pasteurella skyensis]MDP8179140.1 serpin family protein [Pasteurella skyensis]
MKTTYKKHRIIYLATLTLLGTYLSACASTTQSAPVINLTPTESAKLFVEQSTRMGALLDQLRNGNDIALSETGISKLLSAVAKGADGDSQSQIRQFIKEKQLPLVNDKVYRNVNVMYFKNINHIHKAYIKALPDFVIESSISDINQKAARVTKGMIPNAMKNVSPTSDVVLSNIMSFNAKWVTSFFNKKYTKDKDFTAQCGKKTQVGKVATMHTQLDISFVKDGRIRAIALPFKEGYRLVIAMSDNKRTSPAKASQWLYAEGGKHIKQLLTTYSSDVILSLPKLDLSSEHNLIPALYKLGIIDIFDARKANLSKLSTDPLFVNLFEQQVKFQADEKGAKAAAVTTVGMQLTSAMSDPNPPKPIIFDVNHAFAYAIVKDQDYQQIILAGEVNSLGICNSSQ